MLASCDRSRWEGLKFNSLAVFLVISYVVVADIFLIHNGHPTDKVCNSSPSLDSLKFFNQLFVHC
jgi:hypothetical protein